MYVKLTVNKLYYIRTDNDLEEFLTSVDILLQIIEATCNCLSTSTLTTQAAA